MSDEKSYGQCKCPDCGMITSSSIHDKCFCDRDFSKEFKRALTKHSQKVIGEALEKES